MSVNTRMCSQKTRFGNQNEGSKLVIVRHSTRLNFWELYAYAKPRRNEMSHRAKQYQHGSHRHTCSSSTETHTHTHTGRELWWLIKLKLADLYERSNKYIRTEMRIITYHEILYDSLRGHPNRTVSSGRKHHFPRSHDPWSAESNLLRWSIHNVNSIMRATPIAPVNRRYVRLGSPKSLAATTVVLLMHLRRAILQYYHKIALSNLTQIICTQPKW